MKTDIIFLGHPSGLQKSRRVYSIAARTAKGKKWLRRNFQGAGINIMGRTFYHVGRKKVAAFIGEVLDADGLTHRTVEI